MSDMRSNMVKALKVFTLLSLCVTATAAIETLKTSMNFQVVLPDDQAGKIVIASSVVVPGQDQFQMKVTAMQNKTICSSTSCPVPKLVVVVYATMNYKTYSYSATVTGQTLGLNTNLVSSVNVYPQNPEFTASATNTASVNVVFFYNGTDVVPQAWIDANTSSIFRLHIESTTTSVGTPSTSVTPPPVFTSSPDAPCSINLNIEVFLPDTQIGKSVLTWPTTLRNGQIQMPVTASKNKTLCNNTSISCPEPELVLWVFGLVNLKTFTYSATVSVGQTLRLTIDLTEGLKFSSQNPEVTSSATNNASVDVNLIIKPNSKIPSFSTFFSKPATIKMNLQTTVFADNSTSSNPRNVHSSGSSYLGCAPLQKLVMMVLLLVLLLN